MHRLYDALDAYNAAGEEARSKIEDGIWASLGDDVAAMVLDMSGFSRTVRAHGIVYYLAMVRRMQRVTRPLVLAEGGHVVKYEADNLFAVFPDADAALRCAFAINAAFHAEPVPQEDCERRIHVAIGIETGRILHIPDHDFFGDAVNVAALLGEDLGKAGEILIGPNARAALSPALAARGQPAVFEEKGLTLVALCVPGEHVDPPGVELYRGTPLD